MTALAGSVVKRKPRVAAAKTKTIWLVDKVVVLLLMGEMLGLVVMVAMVVPGAVHTADTMPCELAVRVPMAGVVAAVVAAGVAAEAAAEAAAAAAVAR